MVSIRAYGSPISCNSYLCFSGGRKSPRWDFSLLQWLLSLCTCLGRVYEGSSGNFANPWLKHSKVSSWRAKKEVVKEIYKKVILKQKPWQFVNSCIIEKNWKRFDNAGFPEQCISTSIPAFHPGDQFFHLHDVSYLYALMGSYLFPFSFS